ncbi:MAG: hypothetical protein HY287_08000 [Planctomycetes bacterium]|nr:hypothetical protein [Planctomycetota bacterium]
MFRTEDINHRLHDDPFKPFRIHLSDGDAIDVRFPGMVIVGRSTAILPKRFGTDEEGRPFAETWRTIALVHIVQLSDLNERRNGKRRRK